MDNALLFLCAGTGLIVVVGSLLMIWNGRIVIDKEGGSISRVELPFGIRLQTQLPVVMIFLFGAFLLALPLFLIKSRFDQVPELTLAGKIKTNRTYRVYVVADTWAGTTDVLLTVPAVKTARYLVVYDNQPGFSPVSERIDWSRVVNGRYQLNGVEEGSGVPTNTPGVPDDKVTRESKKEQSRFKDVTP